MACLFTSAAWLAGQGQPGAAEGAALATEEEQLEEEEGNVKRDGQKGCLESPETRPEEEGRRRSERGERGERGEEVREEQFM